jgi:hypothetical protein
MSEMTMEDKIFVKQCLDEYNYHAYHNIIPFTVIRRIPGAAMKGDELKELSVITRSSLMNSSSDIYKLFNAYKNKFKPNASIKEIAEEIAKEHLKTMNPEYSHNVPDPFSKAISSVNDALRTINNQIEFIRASYKVADSNDERFNKATVKSILKEDTVSSYDSSWSEIERIEAELNTKKVDPYSPEYGKLIIKRLNSFKADIISAFNKYFGKNSVFAEFNLSDMIR